MSTASRLSRKRGRPAIMRTTLTSMLLAEMAPFSPRRSLADTLTPVSGCIAQTESFAGSYSPRQAKSRTGPTSPGRGLPSRDTGSR